MAYTLVPTELIVDGAITSAKLDTNIAISGTLGVTGEVTLATHLIMGDNDKIKIGTGGDLEIYHDGSNSYISNSTGNIYLGDTNGSVHIQAKLNEESIICASDGAVTLYHDNAVKLATSSAGVSVTGTVTATGTSVFASLDISGDIDVDGTTNLDVVDIDGAVDMASTLAVGGELTIASNLLHKGDADTSINFGTNLIDVYAGGVLGVRVQPNAVTINETGADYDFRVESNLNTHMLFVDGGNDRVGIGTASPSSVLHLSTSNDPKITLTDTGFGASADITGSNGNLRLNSQTATIFDMADSEVARIDSSGNLIMTAGGTIRAGGVNDLILDAGQSGTPDIYLQSGGATKVKIEGSNGNVGIGTSSPSGKLELYENVENVVSQITNNDGNFQLQKYQDDIYLNLNDNGNYIFRNYGSSGSSITERMRIDSSGNVGIGNTVASTINSQSGYADLVVGTGSGENGTTIYSGSNGVLAFANGTSGTSTYKGFMIYAHGDNTMRFGTDATERMRIDSNGTITQTTSSASPVSANLVTGNSNCDITMNSANTSSVTRLRNGTNDFQIHTNGTERMRIDSSGNVTIGSPSVPSGLEGILELSATSRSAITTVHAGTILTNHHIFVNNNGAVGTIRTLNSSTSYNTSSDARLKDITGEARGLEVINALNPVAYNWKVDGKADEGLIAQEVLDIVPNAVSGSEEDMYQMDYSKLVTPLIKAIQEQQTIIDDLKTRIETLEG